MPSLLHPGVYVSEIPSGAHSIEGAPTSTAIFVGETERGPIGPTKITSRADYERLFGGYFRAPDVASPPDEPTRVLMTYAIDGFYLNGGSTAYILRAMDEPDGGGVAASRAGVVANSPGVWGNSISVAFLASSGSDTGRFRIAVVYESPETGERRLVEAWDRLTIDHADENYVVDRLHQSLYIRWSDDVVPAVPTLDEFGSPPHNPSENDIGDPAPPVTGGTGGGGSLTGAEYGELLADRLAGVDDAALLVAACSEMFTATGAEYGQLVDQFIGFAENRPRQDL